uniref:Uncharacterized protein n=1 Tax=Solanum lycopersicum TaxID=4081 RepID=A0A3Q7I2Y6_SOLLC
WNIEEGGEGGSLGHTASRKGDREWSSGHGASRKGGGPRGMTPQGRGEGVVLGAQRLEEGGRWSSGHGTLSKGSGWRTWGGGVCGHRVWSSGRDFSRTGGVCCLVVEARCLEGGSSGHNTSRTGVVVLEARRLEDGGLRGGIYVFLGARALGTRMVLKARRLEDGRGPPGRWGGREDGGGGIL